MTERINQNKEKEIPIFRHTPHFQPRIIGLECRQEEITAFLDDNRKLTIPTTWFSRLRKATLQQLQNYKILSDAYHIRWPEIDEDISLRVFIEGLNSGCC